MNNSFNPEKAKFRTDNVLPATTANSANALPASTPAARSFYIQDAIGKLRAANPGMSYDDAWTTANSIQRRVRRCREA